MKQLPLHALMVLLVLIITNAQAKVEIKEEVGRRTYHFSVDGFTTEPTTISGQIFYHYVMRGVEGYEGEVHQVGSPEIPVLRFYVEGEGEITVKAGPKPQWNQSLPWPIAPVLPSVPKRAHALPAPFTLDQAAYDSRALTGDKTYEVEEMGKMAGVRRRLVTLFPLHSVPAPKYMELLEFEVSVPKPINADAHKFLPAEGYAIVIPPHFKESGALKKLVEFKRSLGYQVFVIEIEGKRPELPPKLRHELMALYADPTSHLKYVLIVGTHSDIPAYQTALMKESKGVTDHYYACLDEEDYEKDRNAPDVSVGRFSARNEEELLVMVEKNIRYEKGKFSRGDWLKRATFISTNDPDHWQYAENSNRYTIEKYTKPMGYTGSFPEPVTLGGDQLFAKSHKAEGTDVLKALKEGRGFINYSGHGLWDEWETPHTTKKDILELSHEATPFIISNACDTAQFIKDSFGEAWQRHPSGSIVFIGSMDTSEWDEDSIFQKKMADLVFGKKMLETRKFMHEVISEVWRFYGSIEMAKYYWEIYATLGDSSLHLRTEIPQVVEMHVEYVSNEIGEGNGGIGPALRVRLKNEKGAPVSGARVALLTEDNQPLGRVYTQAKGGAVIPLAATLMGKTMKLTVSGDNLMVKEMEFKVPAVP